MSTDKDALPGPEEVLKAMTDAASARLAARANAAKASEAIRADSAKLEQYSVRMTIRELYRLRLYADLLGRRPTELARELIAEGLDRVYEREKAGFDAQLEEADRPKPAQAPGLTVAIGRLDKGGAWKRLQEPDVKIAPHQLDAK